MKREELDAQLASMALGPDHCVPLAGFLRDRSRFHIDTIAEAEDELPEFLSAQSVGFCGQHADFPRRKDSIGSDVGRMQEGYS